MTAKMLNAPNRWLHHKVKVALVGCGGNGSEAMDILSQFHLGLVALGGHGLHVTAYDNAIVRESNLVRQRFWPQDRGQYKAITLVNRYNIMFGLDWKAVPNHFQPEYANGYDVLITAVDLASLRYHIGQLRATRDIVWLDLGNDRDHGQAVLGRIEREGKRSKYPHVLDHFEEIERLPDDTTKSCSTAESLASQDMLVNRIVTCAGMALLWELLRQGRTDKNIAKVCVKSGIQQVYRFA